MATRNVTPATPGQSPNDGGYPPASHATEFERGFLAGRDHAVALLRKAQQLHDGPTTDKSNLSAEYREGDPQEDFVAPFLPQLGANPAFDAGFSAVLSDALYYGVATVDVDELEALTYQQMVGPWVEPDSTKTEKSASPGESPSAKEGITISAEDAESIKALLLDAVGYAAHAGDELRTINTAGMRHIQGPIDRAGFVLDYIRVNFFGGSQYYDDDMQWFVPAGCGRAAA